MTHTYQKLTDANVDNYISESFLKIRNNNTPNMLKLIHSERNRGEGGELWQQVSNENKVAAIKYKNISYPYFSALDDRQKDLPNWLLSNLMIFLMKGMVSVFETMVQD